MEQTVRLQPNNFESERIAISEKRRNEGDYLGALTVLLNLEEEGTKNIEVLSSIAAIYFDMEQFVLSSEYWFRYLSQSNSIKVRSRAYSGLSACFCMLGDTRMMAYYSEKSLALGRAGDPQYENVILDYYDYVYDSLGNGYYVSYPEKYIPAKRLMFESDALIDAAKDEEAAARLALVQKDSEYYCEARSKMAQCYLVTGKEKEAEEVLKELVAEFPEDVFANLSYGLYLLDGGKDEESKEYLLKATEGEFFDEEDYFRLAVALCRIEREKEAQNVLERALSINEFCLHVLYLYAIVTHNLGDDETSAASFKKIYSMTRTAVSLYYYKLISGGHKEKLEYTFNLPKSEASKRFAKITLIIANGKRAMQSYGEQEVIDLLEWCLPYETKLQFEFVSVLLSQGSLKVRNRVIAQLLSPNVSNEMKMFIIETLILNDCAKRSVCAAFDNVFLKITLVKGDFEKTRNDFFKRAFAFCFSRLAPFGTDGYKLRETAYEIFYKLKDNGYLKKISDVNALSCAMAIKSGFKMRDELMYEAFFHTKKDLVEAVLSAIDKSGE